MLRAFFLTFFILFSSFITIYPSKKENTIFFDYCYSLEKIISRNSIENSKNLSRKLKPFAKDITLLGTKKTRGVLASKIIDVCESRGDTFAVLDPVPYDSTLTQATTEA